MEHRKPDPISWPRELTAELASTTDAEWNELIAGLIGALNEGRAKSLLVEKVVEAGWTREFAAMALEFAEKKVIVTDLDDEVPTSTVWSRFVRGLKPNVPVSSDARGRLLNTPRDARVWKPWEILALDFEYRTSLLSALNSPTLDDMLMQLDDALDLIREAGIEQGEPWSLATSFSPRLSRNGAVELEYESSGREENARMLDRFAPWYLDKRAKLWLSGVNYVGPIDLTALRSFRDRLETQTQLGNVHQNVIHNLRVELERYARVSHAGWLSEKLHVRYLGVTPWLKYYATAISMHLFGASAVAGFVLYICFGVHGAHHLGGFGWAAVAVIFLPVLPFLVKPIYYLSGVMQWWR